MPPALKKLQRKAYSYRYIIIIECPVSWERNAQYALGPKREDFSQGREDFPERVTLTLNVTEMVGISKAGERMEGEGRLLPSREAL